MDLLRGIGFHIKRIVKSPALCTAPQKLDIKNLTFGVFFYEINL